MVDMVAACDVTDPAIHALIRHISMKMSTDAKNRIGLALWHKVRVSRTSPSDYYISQRPIRSRCTLWKPWSCGWTYQQAETTTNPRHSKLFSGISKLEAYYTPSEQMELLKAGVIPL